MYKKVSIITATFNVVSKGYQNNFYQMFRSIHEQDYPNIEHIIVDGGSADGSVEFIQQIIRRYAKKDVIFKSAPDRGINDATNKGFKLSHGDYITLMCDDDFYTRSYSVSKLIKALEKHNATFSCADCWWSDQFVWRADLSHFATYNPPCLINTMVIKRDFLEKEPYYLCENYPLAGDWDLQMRLLERADIKGVCVHEPLTILRPNGASQQDYRKIVREIKAIFQKHFGPWWLFSKKELYNLHILKPSILTWLKVYFLGNKQIKKSVLKVYNAKYFYHFYRYKLHLTRTKRYVKNAVILTRANYKYSRKDAYRWINTFGVYRSKS